MMDAPGALFLAAVLLNLAGPAANSLPAQGGPLPVRVSQPEPAPRDAPVEPASRLKSLDPAKPQDYFLLAEEVAAEQQSPAGRALARHLYVLAYELDSAAQAVRGTPAEAPGGGMRGRLGASVCLGLAAIADRPDERRWLIALAQSMDERRVITPAPRNEREAVPDEVAFDAATVLGLARAGEGRRAEALFEKPGIADLIAKYDNLPADATLGGLTSFVRKAIRDWPVCPQCKNRRVVPKGLGSKPGEVVLCDTCRGIPGPNISDAELVRQLRVESSLLHGAHRSWSAQVTADGGAPLRDLDPRELAPTYGVDPRKPLWRSGAWTVAGEQAAPPEKAGAPVTKHE